MKIPNRPYQCPLGKAQPTPINLDAIKKSGWLEQHILVISDEDDRLDFIEREFI